MPRFLSPTFLVTRPEPRNERTCKRLRQMGKKVLALPLLSFVPLEFSLPDPNRFDGLIITSPGALDALVPVLNGNASGLQPNDRTKQEIVRQYRNLPLFVVGRNTAARAASLGFSVRETGSNALELAARISRIGPALSLFHPAVRHPFDPDPFARAGINTFRMAVYAMSPVPALSQDHNAKLLKRSPLVVLLYSAATTAAFLPLFLPLIGRGLSIRALLCFSENTARPLLAAGMKNVYVAPEPNEDSLLSLTRRHPELF